jgi:dTDP-4-dehydrorhamnose 3,5-epimerase
MELSAENKRQLYIPPGFAHGFEALVEAVEVQYKQTGFYTPSSEGTLSWNDPDVGIAWPIPNPTLSKRDQAAQSFQDYLAHPRFP